ncbi:ABC transporter permease [Sporichthya sp.]|uniref:ABC transporter permease n=1 Tax=Sporichthya sp. TaxID=65475 RepID=UPI0017AFF56A|nr:ABC transporter permease [Sporichthya sp.]MBA3742828.1 ABC transporter permease [Sporichthya sp.]
MASLGLGLGRYRTIVQRRRILFLLINRDLKVRYSDSALGYVWTVLDPLMMGLVYWFVFDVIFNRGKAIAGDPYLLYLLLAMMPWQWAQGCIAGSTRTLSGEARLIRSVDVPRELWILRLIGSRFIEFMFTIPVLLIFVLGFQQGVNWKIVFFPIAIGMQWMALFGIALALAPMAVMIPDIERLMRVTNRVLLYMCPVIYGSFAIFENDQIPEWFKQIYAWNPFTTILTLYRVGFFPNEDMPFTVALRGGISCVVLLVLGVYIFRKLEPAVLKEI